MAHTFSQKQGQPRRQARFSLGTDDLAFLTPRRAMLSRKASGGAAEIHGASPPPLVNEVVHSPGKPLDSQTRAFAEPFFGRDLSGVRVHTDERAAESARSVRALAYSAGNHIVFASGQYEPYGGAGLQLLSHELAHVVQEGGTAVHDRLLVGEPESQGEREAARTAKEASARRHDRIDRMPSAGTGVISTTQETRPQGYTIVHRQPSSDDDPKRNLPPDWQHGAPTKPVYPDPHVAPAPGTKPEPKQSPYRGPQPSKDTDENQEFSAREKIADALKRAGVPPWAVAAMVVLVVAALADPEPFTKVALLVGAAAAVLIFAALGRGTERPPSA